MIAAVLVLIGAGAILMMHSLFLSYSAIVVLTLVSVCAIISLATMRRDMETNFDSTNRSLHAPTIPEKAVRLDATIAEAYGNAQAIVTIISDDGNYDSAVNLHAVFAKRKLRCTVAIFSKNNTPTSNHTFTRRGFTFSSNLPMTKCHMRHFVIH